MTSIETCPFAVGDEVTVMIGDNPLSIEKVALVRDQTFRHAGYPSIHTLIQLQGGRWFKSSLIGYVSQYGRTSSLRILPTTEEHRATILREGLLALLHQFHGRWKTLPTQALASVAHALQAYLPEGHLRESVPSYRSKRRK